MDREKEAEEVADADEAAEEAAHARQRYLDREAVVGSGGEKAGKRVASKGPKGKAAKRA